MVPESGNTGSYFDTVCTSRAVRFAGATWRRQRSYLDAMLFIAAYAGIAWACGLLFLQINQTALRLAGFSH